MIRGEAHRGADNRVAMAAVTGNVGMGVGRRAFQFEPVNEIQVLQGPENGATYVSFVVMPFGVWLFDVCLTLSNATMLSRCFVAS
jgi:hypothetical protein